MAAGRHPAIEDTEVLSLFPTLVWKARLESAVRERIEASLLPLLERLRRDGGGQLAPDGGWQSGVDLHRREALTPLLGAVHVAGTAALRSLRIGAERLEVTGCWANVNPPGAAHPVHTHPNNFLSGVYYLHAPDGADRIHFHEPRPQASVVRPPVTALTRENTDQVVVQVETGTLLLFPAWLPHSVPANDGEESRASLSFNLMFPAYSETMSATMWGGEAQK